MQCFKYKKYAKWRLKNKVLFTIFLLTAITVLFFLYIFMNVFQKKMDAKNSLFYEQSISNIASYLSDYYDELGALANAVNYNYDLQKYLHEVYQDQYQDTSSAYNMRDYELAMRNFSSLLNERSDITSVMVFNNRRLLLYRSIYTYYSVVMDYSKCEWYERAIDNAGKPVVTGPWQHAFITGDTEDTLSLSRTIYDSTDGTVMGVILLDFNTNNLQEYLNEISTLDGGRICILNPSGDFICEQPATDRNTITLRDTETEQLLINKIGERTQGSTLFEIAGEKYQIVYQTIENSGWLVLAIAPYNIYQKSTIENIQITGYIFLLLMVIILWGLNRILTKTISPVKKLQETVDAADAGNLHIRASVESQDEIGELAESFNAMMDRINLLKEQVIKEQESKRTMELQALQAQINPHFLYNTLDAIIWMAETEDKRIVPMTEALANLFRISLNKGEEIITLHGEIEHTKNYLMIQSMRYEDKFVYQIEIEEGTETCKIIKLILQPIVENSIYHGIKLKRGKGHITIRAYKKQEKLFLKIIDDGVGMSVERCKKNLETDALITGESGSGIGIKNVNERIKLRYGQMYGLFYESSIGEGTTVTVVLPFME